MYNAVLPYKQWFPFKRIRSIQPSPDRLFILRCYLFQLLAGYKIGCCLFRLILDLYPDAGLYFYLYYTSILCGICHHFPVHSWIRRNCKYLVSVLPYVSQAVLVVPVYKRILIILREYFLSCRRLRPVPFAVGIVQLQPCVQQLEIKKLTSVARGIYTTTRIPQYRDRFRT